MSNRIFNVAKGRDVQLLMNVNENNPVNSAFILVLLKVNEAEATLNDHLTLASLLTANTEADATGYVRKTLDNTAGLTFAIDTVNDVVSTDMPDPVWATLGGTVDNTLTKLLVCYDPDTTGGTDTDIIPVYHFDVLSPNNVTNGNNFTAQIHVSGMATQ